MAKINTPDWGPEHYAPQGQIWLATRFLRHIFLEHSRARFVCGLSVAALLLGQQR